MIERQLDIATQAGRMDTFIVHPDRHGPHPIILFYMDAPGIREELRDMARRLASVGYYVVLPNLYYRSGVTEIGTFVGEGEAVAAVRARMFELMATLTVPLIMADTRALLDFAAKDPAASTGPIASIGYCMSGQHAVGAAAAFPTRVKAAASIYGTSLMSDRPDSPHLEARRAPSTEFYFACAEHDHYVPMAMIEPLRKSLVDGGVNAEVEVYPGAAHGFAFPQRPAYDKASAERHWERILALFARRLTSEHS